jgi:hypothetical protein
MKKKKNILAHPSLAQPPADVLCSALVQPSLVLPGLVLSHSWNAAAALI